MIACEIVALLALPRLWFQARAFVETGVSPLTMMARVQSTTWGTALAAQMAAASLGAAAFILTRFRRDSAWAGAAVAVLALTLTPAFMGHPGAAESQLWLNVGVDWMHVVSAGGWVGALTLLAIAVRRFPADVAAALIAAFHRVALISVLGLAATGTAALLLRLADPGALFGSDYGTIFLMKLGCVSIVGAIGAWHSRRAEARVRDGRAVSGSLMTELLLAVVTITVTAVLVGTEPPGT
jgi:putative copper export protein